MEREGERGSCIKAFSRTLFCEKNLIFGTNFQDLANLIIFRGTFKDRITKSISQKNIRLKVMPVKYYKIQKNDNENF